MTTRRISTMLAALGLAVGCGDDGDATGVTSNSATEVTNTTPPASGTEDSTQGSDSDNPTGELTGAGPGGDEESASGSTGAATDAVTSTGSSGGPDLTTGDATSDGTTSTSGDDTTGDPDTGETGETTTMGDEDCQAPATQPPCDQGTSDIFKAMGLNCSDDLSMAIPIKNPVINAPDATSYRVTTHFGSAKDPMDPNLFMWGPKEGERLLAITTGTFPALQGDGGLIDDFDDEENGNPDNLTNLPQPMRYQVGSNNGNGGTPFMNCDGVNDCSDTLDPQWNLFPDNVANDVFFMSFDLTVPIGTHGYLVDFAYFSEEWPYFVDDLFNDMFVVWSTSESFTGNVTFIDNQPLTVTALDPYMVIQPEDPLLEGTGFPGDDEGAGTGWFTAKASAVPGETFTVAITVFDMGDEFWDTVGLIDKFRWDCVGCVPSEVNSCGIEPQ